MNRRSAKSVGPSHGTTSVALTMLFTLSGCGPSLTSRPTPEVSAVRVRAAFAETVIGRSVEGRPILSCTFGDPAHPVVLILGGIHGSEPNSAAVCREVVGYLESHPECIGDQCVVCIPMANPDGLALRCRTNANLVDLNRNFPSRNWKKTRKSSFWGGDTPASQPETKAFIELIERLKPVRIISVHSMDEPCNNYDGPAEEIATGMARFNGYPTKASIGYPTPGSLGSFAGIDRKIPMITLEIPHNQSRLKSWDQNRDALLFAIR